MDTKDFKFILDAYKGSGGFANGEYIDKFPRESDEKYEQRQNIAYYSNIFSSKINRYTGYLFKQKPVRTSSNELINIIFDDIDYCGNSIDVFMSSFAKNAKALGCNLLLVDMPKELPANLKEQMGTRALPYFVEISPDRIKSYKIDKFGRFEYIAFSDIIDNSTYGEEDKKEVVRYYDTQKWAVFEGDDVLESATHELGVCPVLAFNENGNFPSLGEFSQIANLQKRHYNLKSELDEILRGQTFSLLTINADSPSDIELKLSTDNAIVYGNGMKQPSFIAPDSSSATIYQKEIESIEATIDKIAYDISTNNAQESGIALNIKFQGLNSSLSNFAMRLQDLELRAFDIVCRYLEIQNDVEISYPQSFDIVDITQEIEILSSIKELGYTIPSYEKAKLVRIISNDIETANQDEIKDITSEIEDSLKES